jgi:hypothetical protein
MVDYPALARDIATLDVDKLQARARRRMDSPRFRAFRMYLDFRQGARIERRIAAAGRGFDYKRTPVVINSFNRIDCLREQIAWLERAGMTNIIIIDNASTYRPLLEYFERTRYRVVHLRDNLRALALWLTPIPVFREIRDNFYVYTDPDVIPLASCPVDAVATFHRLLLQNVDIGKVGFGLKIDDLPAHYENAEKVRIWEKQFWQKERAPGVYEAAVDTTFALYRPRVRGGYWVPALRTGGDLVARHVPWYADSKAPSEEEQHYRRVVDGASTHWFGEQLNRPI